MDSLYRIRLCQARNDNIMNNRDDLPYGLIKIHLHFGHVVQTHGLSNNMSNNLLLDFFHRPLLFHLESVLHDPECLSLVFQATGMPPELVNINSQRLWCNLLRLVFNPHNLWRKDLTVELYVTRLTTVVEEEDLDQDRRTRSKLTSAEAIEKLETFPIQGLELGEEKGMVCFDEFLSDDRSEFALKLPCGHYYHEECIVKWLQNSNTCPLCRYEMPCSSEN